jgi:hypothetical protein
MWCRRFLAGSPYWNPHICVLLLCLSALKSVDISHLNKLGRPALSSQNTQQAHWRSRGTDTSRAVIPRSSTVAVSTSTLFVSVLIGLCSCVSVWCCGACWTTMIGCSCWNNRRRKNGVWICIVLRAVHKTIILVGDTPLDSLCGIFCMGSLSYYRPLKSNSFKF